MRMTSIFEFGRIVFSQYDTGRMQLGQNVTVLWAVEQPASIMIRSNSLPPDTIEISSSRQSGIKGEVM